MSPLRRSATAAFIVAALVASSCAGGTPSTDTDPSSGTDTGSEVDEPTDPASAQSAEGDALINGVLASFDPDSLDALVAEAAALDRTIALEMAQWSGLEEALGGPEATSAAFASHDQFYATLTNTVAAPPTLGFRRSQANGPSIGEGLFGGFMLVGLGSKAIVQATNDGTTGTATPAKGFTIAATDDSVEMAVEVTHEANGLTTRLVGFMCVRWNQLRGTPRFQLIRRQRASQLRNQHHTGVPLWAVDPTVCARCGQGGLHVGAMCRDRLRRLPGHDRARAR